MNELYFLIEKKNHYIKIWNIEETKNEFNKHIRFLDFNFRVANILSSYEKDEYFIYVEDRVWDHTLWQKIQGKNITYDEWYIKIYNFVKWYLDSQKRTLNINWSLEEILKSNNFDLLHFESKLHNFLPLDLYNRLLKKISDDIKKCKYFTLTHWDFNSMNIFEWGVIDLEDSYNWPLWFDLVTLISHHYWFPLNWKSWRKIAFSFSRNDINKLISLHNKIFWLNITETFNLCFILRWVWATVWMDKYYDEQKYRYNRLSKYIKKYLNWNNLLDFFLDEVDEINKNI